MPQRRAGARRADRVAAGGRDRACCSTRCAGTPRRARPSSTSATASTRCWRSPTGSPCCATAAGRRPPRRRAHRVRPHRAHRRPRARPRAAPRRRRRRPTTTSRSSCAALGRRAAARRRPSTVRRGEVLGIAGLLGSGRSDAAADASSAPYPSAPATIADRRRAGPLRAPARRCAAGIAYVPEDRSGEAVFPAMTRAARTSRPAGSRAYWRGWRLQHGAERRDARGCHGVVPACGPRPTRRRWPRCRAATSRRSCWRGGCAAGPGCCCSTSRPRASTSAPAPGDLRPHPAQRGRRCRRRSWSPTTSRSWPDVCGRVVVLRQGRVVGEVVAPAIDSHRLTELAYRTED